MMEGTRACPPLPPLRCVIVLYTIIRSYRIWGEPSGGGETPVER